MVKKITKKSFEFEAMYSTQQRFGAKVFNKFVLRHHCRWLRNLRRVHLLLRVNVIIW